MTATWQILQGDATERLQELDPGSVQTCVTSPPYYGLRDYGTGEWADGDVACDHLGEPFRTKAKLNENWGAGYSDVKNAESRQPMGQTCTKCGATRTDHQLGLESTPDEYVTALVNVFREVRRVLRDDGTVWLNLGDSYNAAGRVGHGTRVGFKQGTNRASANGSDACRPNVDGMKEKDLLGIPWMVAEALRAPYYTGTIRDERDRIWLAAMIDAEGCMFIHKRGVGQYASNYTRADGTEARYHRKTATFGAGLEISSTDRVIVENIARITGRGSICSQTPEQNPGRKQTIHRWNLRSNECRDVIREVYPYLIAKQHEARLVLGCPSSGPDAERAHESLKAIHQGGGSSIDFAPPEPMFERGWFLRSDIVWSKLPMPNPMPESVTDRPTKSHEYVFLLSKRARYFYDADAIREDATMSGGPRVGAGRNGGPSESLTPTLYETENGRNKRSVWTVATTPFAGAHFATFPPKLIEPCILAGAPIGATVLDPFAGAGTTGLVALRHNRSFQGIELNPEYADLARWRIRDDAPLLNGSSELANAS